MVVGCVAYLLVAWPSFSGVVGAGWPSVRGRVIEGEAVG